MSKFSEKQLVALKSNPDKHFPIIDVLSTSHGETRYKVFVDNDFFTYYESQLIEIKADTSKRVLLTASELKVTLTALELQKPSISKIYSLNSGRIQFVPYQYRPVLKLIRADRPRLLIADEVGVGKTIESGLIIRELKSRMDINSVLIICPKALVAENKWHKEMKRFNEDFHALDGKRLRYCLDEMNKEGEWSKRDSHSILPFSLFGSELLEGKNGLEKLDPQPKFDLVIVDEAHHLRNSETWLHKGVKILCEQAQAVIFLTATPIQLKQDDLYILLNLLRPDLIIDRESFKAMTAPNPYLNQAISICRAKTFNWQTEVIKQLQNVANTEWGNRFFKDDPDFIELQTQVNQFNISDIERIKLIRRIESFYTFGDLINRTRRRDIGNFTQRKPQTIEIEFTAEQRQLHNSLIETMAQIFTYAHGEKSIGFMLSTIRRQVASCIHGLAPLLREMLERKLDDLDLLELSDWDDLDDDISANVPEALKLAILDVIELAEALPDEDPKLEQLLSLIEEKQHQENNKMLLFSSFRHTLRYLVSHIPNTGIRVGLIHGDISHEERAELRHRFSLPREDVNAVDLLLSSEVGCEGLDFQFCDYLINYDLPWNPMRIEQRIGRIDRYGQKSETVIVVNFVVSDTVDSDIYHRCLWRIGVFTQAIGGCETILGDITQKIHSISEQFTLTPEERRERLQQLADNDIRLLQEQEILEEQEANLFGVDISQNSWNETLEKATSPFLSADSLQNLISHYLQQRIGKEQEVILGNDKSVKNLRLSQEARDFVLQDLKSFGLRSKEPIYREFENWLKGKEPYLPIAFTQEGATENNRAVHIDVLHPLTKLAVKATTVKQKAYASIKAFCPNFESGSYPFAIYRWDYYGEKSDQEFIAITEKPELSEMLVNLLADCETGFAEISSDDVFDKLDSHHYDVWHLAQKEHQSKNQQRIDHKLQSLKTSYRARVAVLEDTLKRSSNLKIQRMKQSELDNANLDYQRRVKELEMNRDAGDLHAEPIFFGIIEIWN
jgi:superfamily II DNA or RNA helicase